MNLLPLAIYYSLVRIVMALLPTGVRVPRYLLPPEKSLPVFTGLEFSSHHRIINTAIRGRLSIKTSHGHCFLSHALTMDELAHQTLGPLLTTLPAAKRTTSFELLA